jgi:hypothetical protein
MGMIRDESLMLADMAEALNRVDRLVAGVVAKPELLAGSLVERVGTLIQVVQMSWPDKDAHAVLAAILIMQKIDQENLGKSDIFGM